jgi:hypothetical protein
MDILGIEDGGSITNPTVRGIRNPLLKQVTLVSKGSGRTHGCAPLQPIIVSRTSQNNISISPISYDFLVMTLLCPNPYSSALRPRFNSIWRPDAGTKQGCSIERPYRPTLPFPEAESFRGKVYQQKNLLWSSYTTGDELKILMGSVTPLIQSVSL